MSLLLRPSISTLTSSTNICVYTALLCCRTIQSNFVGVQSGDPRRSSGEELDHIQKRTKYTLTLFHRFPPSSVHSLYFSLSPSPVIFSRCLCILFHSFSSSPLSPFFFLVLLPVLLSLVLLLSAYINFGRSFICKQQPIQTNEGGEVAIKAGPQQAIFHGTSSNGITSGNTDSYIRSFEIVAGAPLSSKEKQHSHLPDEL